MARSKKIVETVIGGFTIDEWDLRWVDVAGGFTIPHPELRRIAGLYRANLNGETKVIGMASERRGGRLSKRLSDFSRRSASARKHRSGIYIHDNLEVLDLQVLLVGDDIEACKVTPRLKTAMTARHQPSENVPPRLVRQAAFG